MGYNQIRNSNHKYEFMLTDVFGGGWQQKIFEIIAIHIYPEFIEQKVIKAGWHNSQTEISFKKFNIVTRVIFDEVDTITIVSDDDKITFDIVENWVRLIDDELGKIK
jgi:hypothetical protein